MLPPHSDPIVIEFIAQLQQQLDAQAKQIQADAKELDYSRQKIQLLEERLRQARIAKYGNASEKLGDLQLELLELEPGVSSEEVQAESEREPFTTPPDRAQDQQSRKPARKHPGRRAAAHHANASPNSDCIRSAVPLR
jgi:hypothetical protein